MMQKTIVHISESHLSEETGMGRVAWHWKNEFEKRGYDFCHIGPTEVGTIKHPALFPYAAYQVYRQMDKQASIFLIHEPASGIFIDQKIPMVVVSHGLERRSWELTLDGKENFDQYIKWRTRLLFPLWRLNKCDVGLRKARLLLLMNQQDSNFAQQYYKRKLEDIYVFKNGVYSSNTSEKMQDNNRFTILFLGSWLKRKGIKTLVEAAKILKQKNIFPHWLLAGTGLSREKVLSSWSEEFYSFIEVIPYFNRAEEEILFARSQIFVLPSYFEGQPLALLQAMEAGRCCITTNCCGQRDFIQNNYNGFLHQPGDAYQLANLIEKCLKNNKLRENIGKNAKASVQNRDWNTVSAEVVEQIEKLLI
jgi:glycosyltransferase involved in cell wall biosynthesis